MLSLTINDTFDGLDQNNGSPPDSMMAAGPANLLATVNRELALFDKDGNLIDQSTSQNFFPQAQTVGFNPAFDPWTIYDPYSQRFVVMYEEVELGTESDEGAGDLVTGGFGADEANILIAISRTDEPDELSASDWIFLDPIDATTTNFGADSWIDYPKFATDEDSIYITGNFFSFGNIDFEGVQIIRADKIDALNGITTVDARIDAPSDVFTLQPAQSMFRDAGDPQAFVAADGKNNGVDVFVLDDANILSQVGNDLGSSFSRFSGGVPQQGTADTLDSISDRLMNAVQRFGSIWTTHTVDVEGDATVRWYEIDYFTGTSGGDASFVQQGDINPGEGVHTFIPAINADLQGNMAIAFNQSSSSTAASFRVTGRQDGQPNGFTFAPQIVATGAAGYDPSGEDIERWGDYTGLALDPQDNHTFWAFGEVAQSTTTWTTDFAQFELTPMVLDPFDAFGTNNSLSTATVLGSQAQITLQDLTIHNEVDLDYYKVTADETGKLIVNAYFQDALGDIDLFVFDGNGNLIASSLSATDNEQIIIPVVSQEMYFVRVEGFSDATNIYDLEIENFAAPAPAYVDLTSASDTGMMDNDNITNDTTPTFLIQADLVDFQNMGITLLDQAVIDPNGDGDPSDATNSGAGVFVTLVNLGTGAVVEGFADQIGASGLLWTFTPATPLTDGDYFVSSAVQIVDGQDPRASGRAQLSDPLVITIIGAPGDGIADMVNADLLTASDTGMLNDDNVTNKMQPAFQGIAPTNYKVRLYANGELVGQTVAGSDTSDVGIGGVNGLGGAADDGLGLWEITTEPLADDGYDITLEVEDPAGNVTIVDPAFNDGTPIDVWIDTAVPNTPLLDLIEVSDTGRHDADDITNDSTPTFLLIGDDTVGGNGNPFPNDLKYRLYDRPGNGAGEVLIFDSFAVFGNFVTFGQITFTSAVLADGVHNLKLETEDRAGNISPDFLLEITVDTVPPPVSFGLPGGVDGLAAESDSGVNTMPETYADRITSDTTPTLWGQAEADSIVRVYADVNGNGFVDAGDALLGQTVAVPWDGNQAFTDGYWEITSVVDLNDPAYFPLDGLRNLLVTAEDVAGNLNDAADENGDADQALDIFIDTQGPRIDAVYATAYPDYDVFDPKPSENGPTPLIDSITIDVVDLPNRVAPDFLYDALKNDIATNPGNYLLVGDHVGIIAIDTVAVTASSVADGAPATASITLTFATPLPDDRYTFTISDNLVDPAGNALDGESNADEPSGNPVFPSGDGVPGGDLVARFTIDSRPEIGSYVAQGINLDINGNFVWDPANGQIGSDATNVDLTFTLPVADPDGSIGLGGYNVHDLLFAGKFAPRGGLIVGEDAIFVIDVSGSTSSPFGGDPVGDLNGDGLFDTILDAEIASFIALNQELVDRGLGNTSSVAIVAFSSSGFQIDMDPLAGGLQLATTPLADVNANGIRDVDEALMSLLDGGLTNYEDALAKSIDTINAGAVAVGDANVIFLSDGFPTAGGTFTDEVDTLRNTLGVNLRAFGVGPGASLAQLLLIDPDAETFSSTNELLDFFGGGGIGPGGSINGFDQLAAYGNSAELGAFRWIIDTNSDGVVNTADGDILSIQPLQDGFDVAGAIPLAGNFDRFARSAGSGSGEPIADNGDEIVLYNLGTWILDTDRDFVIETNGDDTIVTGTLYGHPIIGDFDGDGLDDLAVFNNNVWYFDLANDGLGDADADGDRDQTLVWGFPGVLDRPIAADMDQDGIDDIGLWVPRDSAQLPQAAAEWFFLISNDFDDTAKGGAGLERITGEVNMLDHPFEPVPFGFDLYAEFGEELALPIVGNFDPPTDASDSSDPPVDPKTTILDADFDFDGDVDGADFLIWQTGFGTSSADEASRSDGDADRDGDVDGDDFLIWQNTVGSRVHGNGSFFDFGTSTSPAEYGYTEVLKTTTYDVATGYGWQSGTIRSVDRGIGSQMDRDLNYTRSATFAADMADGTYDVTVRLGDMGAYSHDRMAVYLEGAQIGEFSTGAGEFIDVIAENVVVSDGQLTLRLVDQGGIDGNVVIAGLSIRETAGGGAAALLSGGDSQTVAPVELTMPFKLGSKRVAVRTAVTDRLFNDWGLSSRLDRSIESTQKEQTRLHAGTPDTLSRPDDVGRNGKERWRMIAEDRIASRLAASRNINRAVDRNALTEVAVAELFNNRL